MSLKQELLKLTDSSPDLLFADDHLKKIFLSVFLSSHPISQNKVAKETGLSLASISNKANLLVATHILKKVKLTGDKQAYYEAQIDILGIVKKNLLEKTDSLHETQDALLDFIKQKSKKSLAKIEKQELVKLKELKKQLDLMLELHRKMLRVLDN
jgi:DNA-binding transcriptional regulator GbsR (MarR family)